MLAQLFGVASVTFGGSALAQAQGRFGRQPALLGRLLALTNGIFGFLVEQGGDRRRAALVTDRQYRHGAADGSVAQQHAVARLEFTRRFGDHAVHLHPALVDFFAGQTARLVETRRPQPLVKAQSFHFLRLV